MLKNDYLEMTQIIQHTKAKMDKWTSWDKDRLLHHKKPEISKNTVDQTIYKLCLKPSQCLKYISGSSNNSITVNSVIK